MSAETVATCPQGVEWCTDHRTSLGHHVGQLPGAPDGYVWIEADEDGPMVEWVSSDDYDGHDTERVRALAKAILAAADKLDQLKEAA